MRQLYPLLVLLPLLTLLLCQSSCVDAPIYPQHDLAGEILSPRPGHDGKLTNQACGNYKGSVCQEWSLKEYDLSDAAIRKELNDLNFVCKITGKRYKVCMDKPGFCRRSTEKGSCFLFFCNPDKVNEDFFPMDPYQRVLDSGVKCFNQSKYDFQGMP